MVDVLEEPLVSVVITSYNRASMIENAIRSALEQDYKNIEIIISDNCSTDNTDEIIKKYTADRRVKYTRNPVNVGMMNNFKQATEQLAKGLLITYISSDDKMLGSTFISEAVTGFKTYPNLVAYAGISKNHILDSDTIEHNSAYEYKSSHNMLNRLLSGKEIFVAFQDSHVINFGAVVFVRKDMVDIDVFNEHNTTYADLQAILLLALRGDFYMSGKEAYLQAFHDDNASQVKADAQRSLLNLSFAEVPYHAAQKINFLPVPELDEWMYNIIRPYILDSMIRLYKTDREEYRWFVAQVAEKHPGIYKRITGNKKWKLFKIIYNNKALTYLFEKLKPAGYA